MSFAEDLWDGFTNVAKWEQQGTAMCKAICRFYRKRAKIEETYGKSLFKLVQQITDEIQQPGSSFCNDTICYGTLGSGWIATCHNTQVQAELHLNMAEQVRKNIVENLQVNTLQLEDQLKQLNKDGERLLVDQEQWFTTLKKTKQSYYKAVKEAEAARSVFDESSESKAFSSKAEKRVNKAGQEAQAAELAYHQQIKHANTFMTSFHNELMPRVMKRLEDIGRSRQQLLLHHFKEFSRISQEMPNGLSAAGNALAKATTAIDVQKDIQDYIKFNKTNNPRPQPFQYEPPSEELSSTTESTKKSKHFFTLSRKSKSSSPTLKGNPGSPPSLSPATSSLIIREKPFKFTIFGNSLDDIMSCQKEVLPDCDIPYFLLVLVLDILRSNAFSLEGVFRVPAPTHETEMLCKQFDSGNYDLSSAQSAYTTTHLIKKWCRDLPDPLIPSYLYERCIACTSIEEAREIIPMIPPMYNKVVMFLAQLLHEFSLDAYSEQSKMNSANFAMVFSPSFLRCASTDMADFLLNVHREKNFVQLLIDGAEQPLTTDYIERMMAPLDDIIFTKGNPKWHHTKREISIPPLQLNNLGGEAYNSELKSELQRQASEREMILVKQQQLLRLTAKEDLTDPKVLHARLLDERAEKERYQDSLVLKDKTIQVMRTELNHTLNEKLQLENAVKALQVRIEKLEGHVIPTNTPLALSDSAAFAGLASWSPMRINVKENIHNYELRTRSFRSGSVDTGVERMRSPRVSSTKLHRSVSPVASRGDNRNTINVGDILGLKLDSETIAPFKLPLSSSPSSKSFLSLSPVSEEQPSSSSAKILSPIPSRLASSSPTLPRRTVSARASPTKEIDNTPSSPRRSTVSSPRGVSFRDLSTVHVYEDAPTQGLGYSEDGLESSDSIPRLKVLASQISSSPEASPRARHTLHVSNRSPSPSASQSPSDINSPRNPRHSTPAGASAELSSPRLHGISTIGFSAKTKTGEPEHPSSIGRTFSFSTGRRKNPLGHTTPSSKKESEKKGEKKSKQGNMTSSIDDQRIFDLLNTNVQQYEVLSKKDVVPPSPKSSGFPFKLRLLIQKQSSKSSDLSASMLSGHKTSSKHNSFSSSSPSSGSSTPTSTSTSTHSSSFSAFSVPQEEAPKSPRSPKNSPRLRSPRNKPQKRPSLPTMFTRSRSPSPAFIPVGTPVSPRSPLFIAIPNLFSIPEDSTSSPATSPRQNRRTLSFPTPRAHSSSSSLNVAHVVPSAQSPRPTRSQTFLANGAASTQDLHNLALDVDRMKKEVHKRLCACVEIIGNTTEYTQTIEISKSIRLLIKCLDLALSKLGVEERQMRQLGTGKSTLPEMKPPVVEDSRLKKLKEVLVISLDKIEDQMRCLGNVAAQITMNDDVNIISQTLGELQLFFSKQDQTISKIGPQEMVEGIQVKIEELKNTWNDIPLDRQVELSKIVLDLKKEIDEFFEENEWQSELLPSTPTSSRSLTSSAEGISKNIFSTLDTINARSMAILQHVKQRNLRQSDNAEEGRLTEKLLEIFKSLSTK